jgi:predicted nucleotidyltransferase
MSEQSNPFPAVERLGRACGCKWKGFQIAADETVKAERKLRKALSHISQRRELDPDSTLVLFGSFARYEMLEGSDYDWALLIDGVANAHHTTQTRDISKALKDADLISPGSTGTFGTMVFSHDLVHCIGGDIDSNVNFTRRMLMLLESRPFSLTNIDSSNHNWRNVVSNILERYFEEDVHFSAKGKCRVPRFLLNDITRYWRTICVDYAAKYREQDGAKWALRNAKIRFSRKLLYASGLAFCLSCELNPPKRIHKDLFGIHQDYNARPFIESAFKFARTPPLEYLAAFVEAFVTSPAKRKRIAENIFGAYNEWLLLLNDGAARKSLAALPHSEAKGNPYFERVRKNGSNFATGLRELFFNRSSDEDQIANLSLNYVGF